MTRPVGRRAARDRILVTLPDGRTGRLIHVDPHTRHARIITSQRVVGCHADQLARVEDTP